MAMLYRMLIVKYSSILSHYVKRYLAAARALSGALKGCIKFLIGIIYILLDPAIKSQDDH